MKYIKAIIEWFKNWKRIVELNTEIQLQDKYFETMICKIGKLERENRKLKDELEEKKTVIDILTRIINRQPDTKTRNVAEPPTPPMPALGTTACSDQ